MPPSVLHRKNMGFYSRTWSAVAITMSSVGLPGQRALYAVRLMTGLGVEPVLRLGLCSVSE